MKKYLRTLRHSLFFCLDLHEADVLQCLELTTRLGKKVTT